MNIGDCCGIARFGTSYVNGQRIHGLLTLSARAGKARFRKVKILQLKKSGALRFRPDGPSTRFDLPGLPESVPLKRAPLPRWLEHNHPQADSRPRTR